MDSKTFFNKIKAGAYHSWKKYKILPSVVAAQAALESGWGESELTKQANNLFGIKGAYNGQSVTMPTAENIGGWITVNAQFRKYPSWSASVSDHGELVGKAPRYKAAVGETNYSKSITAIWAGGYATDPAYPQKIIATIESNNLQAWDRDAIAGGSGGDFDEGGSGSDEFRNFQTDLIKENSATRPKLKLSSVKAIVMHEIRTNQSAKAFKNALSAGNSGQKMGYHVIMDDKDCLMTVPFNEGVYHANRTGKVNVSGLGNPNTTTLSIGIISKSDNSFSDASLIKGVLAVAEIANLFNIPYNNVLTGYQVDGVPEPAAWWSNHFLYSSFITLVKDAKEKGANVITNPNFGQGESGGASGDFIPGGEGVIKKVIEEALYWEGKLSYSMEARYNIYPGGSADCSSYMQYVFKKVTGRDIGSNTWAQVVQGKEIPLSQARPGDLIFFEGTYAAAPPTHVALCLKSGNPATMINCQSGGVVVETVWASAYTARRVFSDSEYDQSQSKVPSVPSLNPKSSYVLNVKAPVNATNADIGGVSQRRLSPNENYRVLDVGTDSLKIGRNLWVPKMSSAITISQLATSTAPIGSLTTRLSTRVYTEPSTYAEPALEKGSNKVLNPVTTHSIYAVQNGFAQIDIDGNQWAVSTPTYASLDINLSEEFVQEVDFTKGQNVETMVRGRLISKEYAPVDLGINIESGISAFAHELLLPIGSIISIEVPTKPSLNRKAIVVSNLLQTDNGNDIELAFHNELDRYNFGARNCLVKLESYNEPPKGISDFYNLNNGIEEDESFEEFNLFNTEGFERKELGDFSIS